MLCRCFIHVSKANTSSGGPRPRDRRGAGPRGLHCRHTPPRPAPLRSLCVRTPSGSYQLPGGFPHFSDEHCLRHKFHAGRLLSPFNHSLGSKVPRPFADRPPMATLFHLGWGWARVQPVSCWRESSPTCSHPNQRQPTPRQKKL